MDITNTILGAVLFSFIIGPIYIINKNVKKKKSQALKALNELSVDKNDKFIEADFWNNDFGIGLKSEELCFIGKYEDSVFKDVIRMKEIKKRHSLLVAHVATILAQRAADMGFALRVPEVRAGGLLHDIAKTYSVKHGGSHAQIGAAWTVAETGNYAIAQGVMMHVWWPWALPHGPEICSLPFFVIYADKRIRHDSCVTLEERYEDLLERYGRNAASREGIGVAYKQGKNIESALEAQLGWTLHENSFDCGRVVD